MSEYQFYEFIAVDRPLSVKEMDEVGGLSTRAKITPTSFTNEYHWGSFRGDPLKMMERYYDLHVYYANWGTVRWMLRIPRDGADEGVWKMYEADTLGLTFSGEHVIVELSTPESEEPSDDLPEPGGWSGHAQELRRNLMAGDTRVLYLAWLLQIGAGCSENDEVEPPVPAGLRKMTPALKVFCDAFGLDPLLLAAAAEQSAELAALDENGVAAWISQLPEAHKDALLLGLYRGEMSSGVLQAQYAKSATPQRVKNGKRTVGQLLARAAQLREAEEARNRQEAERDRLKREKARHERLRMMDRDKAWQEVEALASSRQRESYRAAATLLLDLRDASALSGQQSAFVERLRHLMSTYARKPSLVELLRNVGLA